MPEEHPTIVAVLPKDGDARPILERAAERARESGARVILYDVGATGNPLESPLPTEFASDGPDRGVPPVLTVDDLEAAGQGSLAGHVRALAGLGIDAYGWLPEHKNAEDLVAYARAVGATTVLAEAGSDPTPEDLRAAGLPALEIVPAGGAGSDPSD